MTARRSSEVRLSDDQLDALARTLGPEAVSADRLESNRTALLAAAESVQPVRRRRAPVVMVVALPLAAAAAVAMWFVLDARPGGGGSERTSARSPAVSARSVAPAPRATEKSAASSAPVPVESIAVIESRPHEIIERDPPRRTAAKPAPTSPDRQPAVQRQSTAAPTAAAPGENDFRAGWSLLRAGKPGAAAASFAAACKAASGTALAEDACFWEGASARRAGKRARARSVLTAYVRRFPHSSRSGEASALLGWLLFDDGELDAAEKRFRAAASDSVPDVRASARRGLDAVAGRRAQ